MKTKNMTTLHSRKSIGRSPLRRGLFLITLVLAWFALSPAARALNPLPDGDYINENTAEGEHALFHLTSGEGNTAIGFSALFSNTTGGGNTANGGDALESNTSGFDNTATGFGALLRNTTGSDNMANGSSALLSNTNR